MKVSANLSGLQRKTSRDAPIGAHTRMNTADLAPPSGMEHVINPWQAGRSATGTHAGTAHGQMRRSWRAVTSSVLCWQVRCNSAEHEVQPTVSALAARDLAAGNSWILQARALCVECSVHLECRPIRACRGAAWHACYIHMNKHM